jgi:tripartite-type tricarboxylate transporter receptor subunit TctC
MFRIASALMAALFVFHGAAQAQRNDDNIRVIVPYATGGVADLLTRGLAEAMRKQTGKVFVIENAGGAGGTIGATTVARAKPDGRTFMFASTSALTIAPILARVSYDPLKDFTVIRGVVISPAAIVATKQAPFTDMKGALDYARAHPGAVRYGTPGVGSVAHLAMESLQAQMGVSMSHVPYRGDGPALQDALAGVYELLVTNTPSMLPHVKAGTLKPLALMEPKRLDVWPDVPTMTELGYKNMVYRSDFGIFAPAGMSPQAAESLASMIRKAADSEDFHKLLQTHHVLSAPVPGKEYAARIASEHKRNADIIRARKIAP